MSEWSPKTQAAMEDAADALGRIHWPPSLDDAARRLEMALRDGIESSDRTVLPGRRTISFVLYEPWLLGWARWEVVTDLHYGETGGRARAVLAAGRWKWRGRGARFFRVEAETDLHWAGPDAEVVAHKTSRGTK